MQRGTEHSKDMDSLQTMIATLSTGGPEKEAKRAMVDKEEGVGWPMDCRAGAQRL